MMFWIATGLGQSSSTTGSIVGRIRDSQGAVLAGATVVVKQLETNLVRTVEAGEDGQYQLLQLPPGTYEITVQVEGFAIKRERISLSLGTTALAQLTLLPTGSPEDIIEVKASETANAGKTENSFNLRNEAIDNLPINRRSFLDFSLIVPRVTPDRLPNQGATNTSGLSFNGQPARQNNISIDGLDNNDRGVGTARSTFSQEAVREFQVVSDSYTAEFGRAIGGIVNIVTKSGTNDLHGSLFGFLRNEALAARDPFSPIEPPFRQYQFGASLGGPIRKDKLFFFAAFERLSVLQNNVVTITDATVAAANRLGFPLRNGPIAFGIGGTSLLARADAQLSKNDLLTFRYNFGGAFNGAFEPFGALTGNTSAGTQRLDDDSFAVTNNYVSETLGLVNETRFLYGRRNQDLKGDDPGPQIRINAPEGLVTFGRGSFLPQPRNVQTYQFVDNVSLIRGPHQLKTGIDFVYIGQQQRLPNLNGGRATFAAINFNTFLPGAPAFTVLQLFDPSLRSAEQRTYLAALGNRLPQIVAGYPRLPLADLPIPQNFTQGFFGPTLTSAPQRMLAAFFQDDISVTPNFLVKLGVRYDYFNTAFIPKNSGNFSPRIAVAYRFKNLPNLSLRAGYGLFYNAPLSLPIFVVQPPDRRTPSLPFPQAVVPFTLAGRRYPETPGLPSDLAFDPRLSQDFQFDRNLKNAYSQQITAAIEYQLGKDTTLGLVYGSTRGIRQLSLRNINQATNGVRPNPARGDVFEYATAYDSYYHGLTFQVNRRLVNRFGVLGSYTLAKAIDNFVDFRAALQELENPFDLRNERGLSLQDVRHRFVVSGTWQLDYTKNPFLRDFQLSTIISLESGRPYNLRTGTGNERPLDIGRNAGVTPGYANVDLRLTRTIRFTDNIRLMLMAEAFNLLNNVNILDFARNFPPDAQGRFTLPPQKDGRYIVTPDRYRASFAPRQIQLGFRFVF